jgi:hypothetical protein
VHSLKPPLPTQPSQWWALPYALSLYAKYHPKEWVAALDIDSSVVGVTLERAMDLAIGALPQLVLRAVLDWPFLLPCRTWTRAEDPELLTFRTTS